MRKFSSCEDHSDGEKDKRGSDDLLPVRSNKKTFKMVDDIKYLLQQVIALNGQKPDIIDERLVTVGDITPAYLA